MSSSIAPASQVPREELAAYLESQGHAPEIIAWKYFDDAFNGGRNRGWAWLKEGRVAGFIGQIPFEIGRGSQRIESRWLCDWSIASYESNRGAGVRLFKRALQDGLHLVLGGNANSLGPMEKMASRTRHAADTEMRLFLRAGAILERLPGAAVLSRGPLGKLPLPRRAHRGAVTSSSVHPGIAPGLEPLLDSPGERGNDSWSPVYSYKYLSWQIGRCPTLRSWTISTSGFGAALVLWHPVASPMSWRATLWTRPGEPDVARDLATTLLARGVAHVLEQGGSEISLVASRSDQRTLAILSERGFSPTKAARPLFIFDGPAPEAELDDMHGLSFLSADLSYRF